MRWIHTSLSSFSESFFWFLPEDISFVTIDFNVLPNILFQIPQKQCYQTVQWKERCNSVRWIHTSQSSFSESFFLIFICGYVFPPIEASMRSQITLWRIHENGVSKLLKEKYSVNLWDELTHHKAVSQSASFSFLSEDICFFHYRPHCTPKYPFSDSTKTVLANCSMKRKVYLCEMNSYIPKNFLRKLLSSFYLWIFP